MTLQADVYTKLENKERDLFIAAQLGKSLLEKNEMLVAENERLNQMYVERLEVSHKNCDCQNLDDKVGSGMCGTLAEMMKYFINFQLFLLFSKVFTTYFS